MKMFNPIKEYLQNHNHKKIIYNLLMIIIVCIIGLITWDTLFPIKNSNKNQDISIQNTKEEDISQNNYQDTAQVQLKQILGQIKGVGEVEVMVTYEASTEVVPASNITKSTQITEEKDAQGGTRTTTQDDSSQNMVMSGQNDKLIVIKEIKPQIRGVVVVAEGAGDIMIKTALIEAVQTIFQVPAHKVMVYEKK
ncbi:sporulation stage III protein AG [Anaerophilus nitritogenes]|uniref:sporulation stage III protein AG n=1 Tax=Anaerophilus nitritogenes TaxID=2498136 RepID=UPI00101B6EEE|nr:sporulation stage III protein AG [Anaerophilus nitritogenes]